MDRLNRSLKRRILVCRLAPSVMHHESLVCSCICSGLYARKTHHIHQAVQALLEIVSLRPRLLSTSPEQPLKLRQGLRRLAHDVRLILPKQEGGPETVTA